MAAILPGHVIVRSDAKNIYIVDYKNRSNGKVCMSDSEPTDIKAVHLKNENAVSVLFDGFEENALALKRGLYCKQCECVLFPEVCNDNDWVLFVETKYAEGIENAFRKENGYNDCMVRQILDTVEFFRSKGILEKGRRATAIVSFPNLIEEFNGTFFPVRLDGAYISAEDILLDHKVLIVPNNSASIASPKRLKFST